MKRAANTRYICALFAGVAACLLSGGSGADSSTEIHRAAAAFYRVYMEVRPAGVPHARARANFAPVISQSLAQLLERADAAERHYAKVTKNRVPPLVEGDLFTSLFEGARSFAVLACERFAGGAVCVVELRHGDAAGKPETRWSDRVHLVRNSGRWVVDDIEFRGDWQFMHKGRLRDLLRQVIREGANARP